MFAKIFAFLMSIFYLVNPYVGPSTDEPIDNLENGAKLTAVMWADSQVSNYLLERAPVIRAAGEDLNNSSVDLDALIIAGDIAENGLQCEFDAVYDAVAEAPVANHIMATGNHDVRLRLYSQSIARFSEFTNRLNENSGSDLRIDAAHYSYEVNGYTFVVMGTDRTEFEEAYISDEQLDWLDETLTAKSGKGKPVFVILHQALNNTHGLPGTWGSAIPGGSVGKQSDAIYEVLNKYSDIILISGHMHTGFGQYTYEKVGNFHSVNLPSITIENKDGDYNGPGIGYMMEVYSSKVVFRARNFAEGVYVPDYNITIQLGK